MHRRALCAVCGPFLLREGGPEPLLGADQPHPSLGSIESEIGEFVGDELIPEQRVLFVNVDRSVGELRGVEVRDQIGQHPSNGDRDHHTSGVTSTLSSRDLHTDTLGMCYR